MAIAARVALAAWIALALLDRGAPAAAQPTSVAQALFDEARRLMAEGRYALACPKFAESERLEPAGGTLLNLAACDARLGRTATAWAQFHDALAQAESDGRPDRIAEARRRIAELEPVLARLVIEVHGPVEGLEVRLDGIPLASASWASPIPVDPGPHRIDAVAQRHAPWHADVEARPSQAIPIAVPPLAPASGSPRSLASAPPAALVTPTRVGSATAWSVGAGGLSALGVGAYFGWVAASRKRASEAYCSPAGCRAPGAARVHEANAAAWASDASFGFGAAAIVIAAVLPFAMPRSARARTGVRASLHVAGLAGATNAGLVLDGSW